MFTRSTTLLVVLLASSIAVADHHETATRKDFEEFRDAMQGRWVGQVTMECGLAWSWQEGGRGHRLCRNHSHGGW